MRIIAGNTSLSMQPRAMFTWHRLGCREAKLEGEQGGHSVSLLSPAASRMECNDMEVAGDDATLVGLAGSRRRADDDEHPRKARASLSRSEREHAGVSLVGVLLMVVLIGLVGAGAMLGVARMTGSSDDASSVLAKSRAGRAEACRATAAAARAAAAVYFANSAGQAYPTIWSDLTASEAPSFTLAPDVVINRNNPKQLDSIGWKLVMSSGGSAPSRFTCS